MKIIFYGTRDYDHLYFDILAADPDYGCTIKFLAANLDPDTAQLAAGGDAVCAFVNSDCGAETLSVLAKAGIKLLLMRCAGYNNVDLAAAKANGITVMRVPGYSPGKPLPSTPCVGPGRKPPHLQGIYQGAQ